MNWLCWCCVCTLRMPSRWLMVLSLVRRALLEAMGTALLAFAIVRLGHSSFGPFEQAWGIGLTLCLLIHLLGRLCGAHFNPAVTLLLNQQRFGWHGLWRGQGLRETGAYWLAQILAAVAVFRLDPLATVPPPFSWGGVVPELIFSAALYGLILAWSREGKICPFAQPLSGVVIGMALVALVMLGGLSGSGLYNPAIAAGLISQGGRGILPMIAAQLLAAVLLMRWPSPIR
jgi:glycerol uptake facilitator-like aquaporin